MSTMSTILSLLFFLSFPPLGKWPLFVRKQCWLLLLHSVENQSNFSIFFVKSNCKCILLKVIDFTKKIREKILGTMFRTKISTFHSVCASSLSQIFREIVLQGTQIMVVHIWIGFIFNCLCCCYFLLQSLQPNGLAIDGIVCLLSKKTIVHFQKDFCD